MPDRVPRKAPRVALIAYPGAQALDVVGPLEVFALAGRQVRAARGVVGYRTEVIGLGKGRVAMGSGLELVADRGYASVRGGVDTLLVAGGDEAAVEPVARDEQFLRWLRGMAGRVRRIGSVCSGAFVLAAAGLLDGRRATTHWSATERLAQMFPRVRVEPDAIFVRDGAVSTSAGITAGMDLALALVEEDYGRSTALAVARQMVMFLKRPGGQSQFSTHLEAQVRAYGALDQAPEWILEHLDEDLSVARLARHFAMSPRNFARVFHKQFAVTPAKFVERGRVERAGHVRCVLELQPR